MSETKKLLLTFLFISVLFISVVVGTLHSIVTRDYKVTYVFKPEPDEIHENNSEICYAWKFTSPMGWEKMARICEEK
jgi:hypothetical protein